MAGPLRILTSTCVFLAICGVSTPCKVANWQPMTVGEQAQKAEIVIYGKIIAHYPMPDVDVERAYIALMDVYCVLKGNVPTGNINITNAGKLTSCHHTRLPVDQTFITFVAAEEGGIFVPDEVNHLSVAFEPTEENIREVLEAVGSRETVEAQTGITCTQLGHLESNDGSHGNDWNGASAMIYSVSTFCTLTLATILWI